MVTGVKKLICSMSSCLVEQVKNQNTEITMEGTIQRRPLKDKLREHWNTRDEIWAPKPRKANKMGMVFSWVYAVSLFYFIVNVLLPNIEGFRSPQYLRYWQTLACFLLTNILVNWCLAAQREPCQASADTVPQSNGNMSVMNPLPAGWSHCPVCQLDVPPRSHHCKVCNVCILKRDHHCFFTGMCVGWANQRRFVVFILYTMLGAIFGCVLIISYLVRSGSEWSVTWYNYLPGMSVLCWMFGSIPLEHFLLLLELYASCIVMFVSGGFLLWECCMIYRGQTSYEAACGKETYRMPPVQAFRSVFGDYGLIHFLLPVPLALPGDGVNWQLYKDTKAS